MWNNAHLKGASRRQFEERLQVGSASRTKWATVGRHRKVFPMANTHPTASDGVATKFHCRSLEGRMKSDALCS